MKIAVLGTGLMGYPMARRLCDAGHTVAAWESPIWIFEKMYSDGVEHGLADLDHAGLFVELASRNGMC